MTAYLLLTLFFVVCQGFFSGMETGMISVLRPRAEHAARNGSRRAALLVYFLHRPGIMIATALIGLLIKDPATGAALRQQFPHQRGRIEVAERQRLE